MDGHIRADFPRQSLDLLALRLGLEPPGENQVDPLAGGALGGLQAHEHRKRVGLGGGGQAPEEQRGDGIAGDVVLLPEADAGLVICHEGAGVDPEGDDRQLQTRGMFGPGVKACAEIFVPAVEQPFHHVVDRAGCADHRIPAL